MAECSGFVVIQAKNSVFQSFVQDRDKGLEELVSLTGADPEINEDCDVFYEKVEIKGDIASFEFVNEYWIDTAKRLVATATNIGLYLRAGDEYGAQFFLAHNPAGDNFSFLAGGPEDDFEIEGGDIVTPENLQQWKALIPQEVKDNFPQLVDVPLY